MEGRRPGPRHRAAYSGSRWRSAINSAGLPLPDQINWPGLGQPRFTWARPTGFFVSYDLIIATDAGLTNPIYTASGLSTTSAPVPTGVLNLSRRYYWGVTAHTQVGSTFSTPGSFTFSTA